ncbi:hypothetical protein RJ641_014596 [Dillenia turbinata]|uniref:Transmembrane protein n=1 Tax=Dillenia turbinata TaxID=194707 RepID=A0AAN8UPP8_9MAGN
MVAGEDENQTDRENLPNSTIYFSSSSTSSLTPSLFSHSNDDLLIFPPINHENLHISSPSTQNDQAPQPESTPTMMTSHVSLDERLRSLDGVRRWFRSGLEILGSKILNFVLQFQSWASNKRAFCSFDTVAGFASAVLVMMVCSVLRQRWRLRRVRRQSEDRLVRLIEEKDEKIIELLHQITRINQALLDRQRVVPGNS